MPKTQPRKPRKTRGVRQPELLDNGRYRGWTWNPVTKKKGPSKVFDTETEADAWMRRKQGELEGHYTEAGVSVQRNRRRWGIADYAMHWAETSTGIEPDTRNDRKSHARQIGKQWPDLMVDEVDRAAIKEYMAHMESVLKLAPASRRNRLGALRNIFKEAILDELRTDDPTVTIESPPRITLRVHRVLTAEEFDRALGKAPVWLRPALLLAHDAGLRLSEVAGLRWRRLDLLHGVVTVGDVVLHSGDTRAYPKGKKVLPVPLTARTVTALRAHQKRFPGGATEFVFVEPGGPDVRRDRRIARLWHHAVVAAEIREPLPCFHDLRHGCGHALRKAGAPIDVIQAVLRHQQIETSKIYMPDVSEDEARQWLNRTQRREARRQGVAQRG